MRTKLNEEGKKFVGINERFGDRVSFDSIIEMENCIKDCGYTLPEDGLREGRDYEIVDEEV